MIKKLQIFDIEDKYKFIILPLIFVAITIHSNYFHCSAASIAWNWWFYHFIFSRKFKDCLNFLIFLFFLHGGFTPNEIIVVVYGMEGWIYLFFSNGGFNHNQLVSFAYGTANLVFTCLTTGACFAWNSDEPQPKHS